MVRQSSDGFRRPDGQDSPFKGVFREIVPPDRLVYTQADDAEPWASHEALITLTFTEKDGKTKITSTSLDQSVEDRDAHLAVISYGNTRAPLHRIDSCNTRNCTMKASEPLRCLPVAALVRDKGHAECGQTEDRVTGHGSSAER